MDEALSVLIDLMEPGLIYHFASTGNRNYYMVDNKTGILHLAMESKGRPDRHFFITVTETAAGVQ